MVVQYYPTYAVAAKREALHRVNVGFSLLFGGGARYSNGEDSLFLHDSPLRHGKTSDLLPLMLILAVVIMIALIDDERFACKPHRTRKGWSLMPES